MSIQLHHCLVSRSFFSVKRIIKNNVQNNKDKKYMNWSYKRVESQWIVTAMSLCHLQYYIAQLNHIPKHFTHYSMTIVFQGGHCNHFTAVTQLMTHVPGAKGPVLYRQEDDKCVSSSLDSGLFFITNLDSDFEVLIAPHHTL